MPVSSSLLIGRGRYQCSECKEHFQLDRFVPFITETSIRWCPLCKGQLEKSTIILNKWQEFAIDGGFDPEQWQLVEELYKIWNPPNDPSSFIDFIRDFVKQISESE